MPPLGVNRTTIGRQLKLVKVIQHYKGWTVFGDVVASVVRVTRRNRHHLDQWNDSVCMMSQPESNRLVEIIYQ